PKMHGKVSTLDGRYLLHWDDIAVDVDAWLDFSGNGESGTGESRRLHMAKIDPDGDFSSDYEDLAFSRIGGCE
ncbi:MAG: penicillin-binding protein, partial [Thermomonas sp.]